MEKLPFSWLLLLLLVLVCPLATKSDHEYCPYLKGPLFYYPEYYDLYLTFEEGLIKNHKALVDLRPSFVSLGDYPLHFSLEFEVANSTNTRCRVYNNDGPAFCRLDNKTWHLCSSMSATFMSQTVDKLESEERTQTISQSITILSLLHGSMLSIYVPYYHDVFKFDDELGYKFPLKLKVDNLTCQPSRLLITCVLSELLSWVSH